MGSEQIRDGCGDETHQGTPEYWRVMDPSRTRQNREGLSVPCGLRSEVDIIHEGHETHGHPLRAQAVRAEGASMSGARAVTATKPVVKHGSSLGLNLSREFALLGADYGDLVKVTMELVDGKEGHQ